MKPLTPAYVLSVLAAVALLFVAACAGGCTAISYTDPAGRSVSILKIGTDTKIGTLNAHAADGTAIAITNLDSESQALAIAQSAINALPALAPAILAAHPVAVSARATTQPDARHAVHSVGAPDLLEP